SKDIKKAGYESNYEIADITQTETVVNMMSNIVDNYNRIDILINNTGVLKDNLILNMPEEDFDFVVNVNLKGVWIVSKAALKYMKENNFGRIDRKSTRLNSS